MTNSQSAEMYEGDEGISDSYVGALHDCDAGTQLEQVRKIVTRYAEEFRDPYIMMNRVAQVVLDPEIFNQHFGEKE